MNTIQRFRPLQPVAPATVGQLVMAQDRVLGGVCVLKFAAADLPEAEPLSAEGALLSDLQHPHILRLVARFQRLVTPWGPEGGITGFASAWVDGLPLTDALAGRPLEEGIRAFVQLVEAVAYLHRRGYVHLDLKPENALHVQGHGPVLLDFGSARSVHAAPGEAGGTLGYAAPEVLAGQAASIAADLYSLGTILYQILTGRPVFGDLSGVELRQAVLAGDVVPVRAVAPQVPPGLARITDELLNLDPLARPASADALLERLAGGGPLCSPRTGEPPFVGRDAELAALHQAVSGAGLVCVWGPTSSGRTRLVRHLLHEHAGRGAPLGLDLTQADDPLRALGRLATLHGAHLPAPGAAWTRSTASALERVRGLGPVYFGRREALSAERLVALDLLGAALIQGGVPIIWATTQRLPGSSAVAVGPLAAEAVTALGRFYGVPGGARLREVARRVGELPGPLIRALVQDAADGVEPSDVDADALTVLRGLPSGIPQAALDRLPLAIRLAVPRLVDRALARRGSDGSLYLDRLSNNGMLPQAVAASLREVAEDPSLDPLWAGLLAARQGWTELAAGRVAGAVAVARDRRDELLELLGRVVDAGDAAARETLARLTLEDGEPERTLSLLAGRADLRLGERVLLARALRQTGRVEAAEVEARDALATAPGTPALWVELGRCRLQLGDLVGTAAASREAARLDDAHPDVLGLEVLLAVRHLDAGEESPDLDALLARVEDRATRPGLSAATLSGAGRILARRGELRRGERVLAAAAAQADQEGVRKTAAGIRLNRANALQRLGQGREAREVYEEALLIAEEIRAHDLRMRIHYSLAELELRAGRLPAAERHLAAFRSDAEGAADVDVLGHSLVLEAQVLQARGRPADVIAVLEPLDPRGLSNPVHLGRNLELARAWIALGEPERARAVLEGSPATSDRLNLAALEAMRGQALLALGRRHLRQARATIPEAPDPTVRQEVGRVLLATAGEDMNPEDFAARRRDLDEAVRLLRGPDAARAATLRDRLLEGPGADLMGVVALIESMQSPQAFPEALARLMTEALGAHRVLITLRLPGLGQQISYKELSGQEAAGISEEVLRRIQGPRDFWLSGDAFADPHLRETSRTVRTFELKSLLAVAIPHGGKAVGALYVDDLVRADRFTPADVDVLQRLATAVGRVLGLLSTRAARRPALVEPVDVYGVLLSDPSHVEGLRAALDMLDARRPNNLLITGPTGAGKTWFAKRVARERLGLRDVVVLVMRKGEPQWLVTQLAGTRRGEFTGAVEARGAIRQALDTQCALFIDEVQNLDEEGQQILLPLLDLPERRFGGLTGEATPVHGNVHIILGTNADVSGGRWARTFREDLWYRMSRVHAALPPLSDRGSEVVYRHLATLLADAGAPPPEQVFDGTALHRVTGWHWPGNLRELSSFAQNASAMYTNLGRPLGAGELGRLISALDREEEPASDVSSVPGDRLDQTLLGEVLRALRGANFVQRDAAQRLGIQPARLNKFLKRHNLLSWVREQRKALHGASDDE